MTEPILNIAAYHFVSLADTERLQVELEQMAARLALKGTILIATEGINLFLAAAAPSIESFVHELTQDARFTAIEIKRSWSAQQPFKKMRVKIKPEIIRMNHPTIRPSFDPQQPQRAPAVNAQTLQRWLDQGCDDLGQALVLLDTRNDFEVDYGTFNGALDWRIQKFSDFPAAFDAHRPELEGKTVVSFCTGGLRCEKAAIYMRQAGLDNVYQLEGGILKYFEETQGSSADKHYHGHCFVFDQREALDSDLKPQSFGRASRFAPRPSAESTKSQT